MIDLKTLNSLLKVVRRNQECGLWDWVDPHLDVVGLSVTVALSLTHIFQLQVKIREQIVIVEHLSRCEQELCQGKMNLEDDLFKTHDREKQNRRRYP
jgi:hypothetical protein